MAKAIKTIGIIAGAVALVVGTIATAGTGSEGVVSVVERAV